MGHPDGAHTHGGGGGAGGAILLLIGIAFAVSVAGAVASALASLLAALAIAAVSILGCTALALVGIGIWRLRRGPRPPSPPAWQSIQPPPRAEIPKAQRPAIEQPRELHLHLHGIGAEDLAAIVRRAGLYGTTSEHPGIKEDPDPLQPLRDRVAGGGAHAAGCGKLRVGRQRRCHP